MSMPTESGWHWFLYTGEGVSDWMEPEWDDLEIVLTKVYAQEDDLNMFVPMTEDGYDHWECPFEVSEAPGLWGKRVPVDEELEALKETAHARTT